MAGATIVFCDIVGFSQKNNTDQRELITRLSADVTHELYDYLTKVPPNPPQVISLPTGDGLALALVSDDMPRTEVLFSLISRLVLWGQDKRHASLRVGVHTGEVFIIPDINGRPNVCGSTVNICQRIMDAANPGQVLLSSEAHLQYVGSPDQSYPGYPFSAEAPAEFKGPFTVVAKHGVPIQVYVMYRRNTPGWAMGVPPPRADIWGRRERTQFIIDQLEECNKERCDEFFIYEQATFSTFGIADRDDSEMGHDYLTLLKKQRKLLWSLVKKPNARTWIIVNPQIAPPMPSLVPRLDALIGWMEDPEILANNNILFLNDEVEGPNCLIVKDRFCIEGFKLHRVSGYEMSIVRHQKYRIEQIIKHFNRTFESAAEAGKTKQAIIQELKIIRSRWCEGVPPKTSAS